MKALMLAFAFLALAAPARAQTGLMGDLDRYCIAPGGSPEAALAAARAAGLVAPPASAIPALPSNIKDGQALWSTTDGKVVVLMTGHANDPGGLKGDFCAVASIPPAPEEAKALGAWLGAPKGLSGDFTLFTSDASGRKIVDQQDRQGVMQALAANKLKGAGAKSDKKMTMLMLLALRPL